MERELTVQTTTEAAIDVKVIRCGCGDPLRIHERDENGGLLPCPTPRQLVDLGTVAYYNEDPEKQAEWDERGQPAANARIRAENFLVAGE